MVKVFTRVLRNSGDWRYRSSFYASVQRHHTYKMCFPAVHLLRVSLKQHVSNSVTVSVNVVIQLNDRSVHPVHE